MSVGLRPLARKRPVVSTPPASDGTGPAPNPHAAAPVRSKSATTSSRSARASGEREERSPAKKKRLRMSAEERRQQVIETSKAVFIRKGFHGARTRDLAEEAGVNEATLFLYFDSKQEIFDAAITQPLRQIVKQQMKEGRAFATAPDAEQQGRIGIQAIREMLESVTDIYPLLGAVLFTEADIGRGVYRRDVYPMIKRLRAAAKISFDVDDDAQAEFIALAALGLCISMHMHHDMLGITMDLDVTAARIAKLLLSGAFSK